MAEDRPGTRRKAGVLHLVVDTEKFLAAQAKRVKRGDAAQTGEGTVVVATPAANTAAVITVTGVAGRITVVKSLIHSYSAAATGGRLSATDGGAAWVDYDQLAAGAFAPFLAAGYQSAARGNNIVATLAAGGAGITGKLNLAFALI